MHQLWHMEKNLQVYENYCNVRSFGIKQELHNTTLYIQEIALQIQTKQLIKRRRNYITGTLNFFNLQYCSLVVACIFLWPVSPNHRYREISAADHSELWEHRFAGQTCNHLEEVACRCTLEQCNVRLSEFSQHFWTMLFCR